MDGEMLFSINKILIAHECVIDNEHKCEYPRGRGCYGIVFALSGEAEYKFVGGERTKIKSGEVMILSPSAAYRVSVRGGFHHYTVNFDATGKIYIPNGLCYVLTPHSSDLYKQLFHRAVLAYRSRFAGYTMLVASKIYEIFASLYSEMIESSRISKESQRLLSAKQYIDDKFTKNITLDDLAALSNMSVTSFRREWHQVFGSTPMKYRDEKRLLLAKDMLIEGNAKVGEIALACGFEDASYFVRFFKKHTGFTPMEYKKSLAIM